MQKTMAMDRRQLLTALMCAASPRIASARPQASALASKLVAAGEAQIGKTLTYDAAYEALSYPGGDVPIEKGVCTDVVIRAYRTGLGVDLQKLVHEDMLTSFSAYPKTWGLKKTDTNIDHRRVLNLQAFFRRKGMELAVTAEPKDFAPGDLVTMTVPVNLPHIAIVSDTMSEDGLRPLLIHNIGQGARKEDVLLRFPLTGHYRYGLT